MGGRFFGTVLAALVFATPSSAGVYFDSAAVRLDAYSDAETPLNRGGYLTAIYNYPEKLRPMGAAPNRRRSHIFGFLGLLRPRKALSAQRLDGWRRNGAPGSAVTRRTV